jgi:hypothetical protein
MAPVLMAVSAGCVAAGKPAQEGSSAPLFLLRLDPCVYMDYCHFAYHSSIAGKLAEHPNQVVAVTNPWGKTVELLMLVIEPVEWAD